MENNKTMKVGIHLDNNYDNVYARINSVDVTLEMPLTEGIHTIKSSYIEIGQLKISPLNKKVRPIQLSVEVWYRYDPAHNLITLCDSKFVSDDATKLRTRLADSIKTNVQFAFDDTKSPCKGNEEWDYTSPLTPNLKELFQQNIRDINSAIYEEAKNNKMTILLRSPFPDIPKELYENLFLVYEDGMFAGLYDPSKQYGDKV